jgi:hypothetical protein
MKPHDLKVTELYAFFIVDEHGNEGLCVVEGKRNDEKLREIPLIAADLEMVEYLKPEAKKIARKFKNPVKLIKFSVREEIEIIERDDKFDVEIINP